MANIHHRDVRWSGLLSRAQVWLASPPLIAGVVCALALLYSFPWLRVPDVGGVALPFQRVLAWLGLGWVTVAICLRGSFRANPAVRFYLAVVAFFFAVLTLTSALNIAEAEVFAWVRFLSELSKYVAVFATAFIVYYALEHNLVRYRTLERLIVIGGAASIVIAYVLLLLYWSGYRSTNEILANSFGGSLGVWPTGNIFPRLAGTTAEPQQFSVAFLSALMLMLSRRYIRVFWPFALLGLVALVLSQSKFALISLLAVAFYVDRTYKQHRFIFAALLLLLLPPGLYGLTQLPVFQTTIRLGLEAQAFTDRAENLGIMLSIIESEPLDGIGVGQYGTYRGELLFGDPYYRVHYTAGNDIVSIFAETGLFGFLSVVVLFATLFTIFAKAVPRMTHLDHESYLPHLIGAVTIVLNMLIGYEFLHAFFWVNMGILFYLYQAWGRSGTKVHAL